MGCVGSDILIYILPVVQSSLLSNGSAKELIEFLNFVGALTHNFKATFLPLLDEMLGPLRDRAAVFLNKETLGTDDLFEVMETRRAYLTFLANVFNADLEAALSSESMLFIQGHRKVLKECIGNLASLPSTLQFLISSTMDLNDLQSQKIACAVLVKAVNAWGQDPETAVPSSPEEKPKKSTGATTKPPQQKKQKPPLAGFDRFIYESLVPMLFEIPYKRSFNLADGQTIVFLTEIGALHRVIYHAQGSKYLNYLHTVAFPSLNISPEASERFISSISTLEARAFKKFLQVSCFTFAHRKVIFCINHDVYK